MKRRAIVALALALSLLVCAMPAAATTETVDPTSGLEITVNAELMGATIEVTIAGTPVMTVNPYKLTFDGSRTDTLYSPATLITNNSSLPVTMKAIPTADVSSKVKLADASTTGSNEKAVFMFLEMSTVDSSDLAATDYGVTWTTPSNYSSSASDKKIALVKADGSTSAELELAKRTDDTHPTYGAFKISGDSSASSDPTQVWDESTDHVGVKIAFSFKAKIS